MPGNSSALLRAALLAAAVFVRFLQFGAERDVEDVEVADVEVETGIIDGVDVRRVIAADLVAGFVAPLVTRLVAALIVDRRIRRRIRRLDGEQRIEVFDL